MTINGFFHDRPTGRIRHDTDRVRTINKYRGGNIMGRKVVLFLVAIAFVFMACSFSHAAPIKLKLANYFPPTHITSIVMAEYCKEINKRLAGKVEVTQYLGGTLLSATKMAAGVASGIADIGLSHCAYSRGRFPVMEIMELPLGFPSSYIATHVSNDFYNKFQPKEWNTYHPLLFMTSPVNVIQTVSKPIKTLEELKGMKIRGTGRSGDIVKALGAVPMPIETPDLYEAIKRGVVDGAYLTMETYKSFKTGELFKYNTESWKVGSVYSFYVVMNKRKWDSLPPDVQKVFTEVSQSYVEKMAVGFNNVDIQGRDFFIKQGGKMIPISDAESAKWIKAVQPVIAQYKKDMTSKGYKAAEVDGWLNFIKERIEYWKGKEKANKIPTPFKY
ncbi:MAG: 2,3-diketo-L-gulonate-binding periplasmic protein YiaO precursor [Syntrophorhabdus sp. PtaU1.Bin002]|nr:MAG: 2,3-diketo-L-gulonate-binding periplasmic protein YiaO precursor [Syntrophorhabdus sp. PtaU1.Bin002]